jgi:hypothetical protein
MDIQRGDMGVGMFRKIVNLYDQYNPIARIAEAVIFTGLTGYSFFRDIFQHHYAAAFAILLFGAVAVAMCFFGFFSVLLNEIARLALGLGLILVLFQQLIGVMGDNRPLKQFDISVYLLTQFGTERGVTPEDRELARRASLACMLATSGGNVSGAIEKVTRVAMTMPKAIVINEADRNWLSTLDNDVCFEIYGDLRARYPEPFKRFELLHSEFR